MCRVPTLHLGGSKGTTQIPVRVLGLNAYSGRGKVGIGLLGIFVNGDENKYVVWTRVLSENELSLLYIYINICSLKISVRYVFL